MRIEILESQLRTLIKERYDSEKLYIRDAIVKKLMDGPKSIKAYVSKLPKIDCEDNQGNRLICTKIPEIVDIFLKGQY